jgi:Family of unknown function (DUF5989)
MNPAFVEKVNQKKKARSSWTARVTSPVQTLLEFNQLAIKSGRGWWLIPMMGMLILLGILLVFIQVIEYVAPFVYTIF